MNWKMLHVVLSHHTHYPRSPRCPGPGIGDLGGLRSEEDHGGLDKPTERTVLRRARQGWGWLISMWSPVLVSLGEKLY
jgi:hypothetical protein